jgi:hypothetical protein
MYEELTGWPPDEGEVFIVEIAPDGLRELERGARLAGVEDLDVFFQHLVREAIERAAGVRP